MNWFLYDRDLRHEKVKDGLQKRFNVSKYLSKVSSFKNKSFKNHWIQVPYEDLDNSNEDLRV